MNALHLAALVAGGLALARHAAGLLLLVRYLLRSRISRIPKGPTPPLSLLVPLAADEPELARNLEAALRQNYPEFEALFLHERPDDPAAARADEAAARVGDVAARRVVGKDPDARNLRVALLLRGEQAARNDILVAADPRVRPDPLWLRDAANALASREVVAFPAVLFGMRTPAARLLGLYADVEGLLATLLARGALTPGATLGATKRALRAIGGRRAVADRLADDLELGRALARQGFRAALARRAARVFAPDLGWRDGARDAVRLAAGARAAAPARYLAAGPFALAAPLLLAAAALGPGRALPLFALLFHSAFRALVALLVDLRFCWDRSLLRALPLLPALWIAEPAVWIAGLLAREVSWRGRRYRLHRGRATLLGA
jgi:ceramide glucosyltransferase